MHDCVPTNEDKMKIMKKNRLRLESLLLLGLAFIVSMVNTSCSSDDEEGGMSVRPDISLNKDKLVLEVGSSERLVASFDPAEAPNKGHTWTSTDNTVASVDETGLVTAVAPGDAVITATALDGGKMASCEVEVVGEIIHVTQVRLDITEEYLTVGDDLQLTATVLPANATDLSVKWTSTDNAVATVDGTGRVTALAEGTAVITATSNEGGKKASCQITVEARGVRFSAPAFTNVTSSTAQVSGTIRPIEMEVEEAGICYSTEPAPTVADQKVRLSTGDVTYTLNSLQPGTTYYARFYAVAEGQTYYSDQEEFTTTAVVVTSFAPTDVYVDRIILTSPAPAGITSVDICYGTSPNPEVTDYITTATVEADGLLHLTLKNLKAGTTYYLRSYTDMGNGSMEYHDDEVSVKTVGAEDFRIDFQQTSANQYIDDGYFKGFFVSGVMNYHIAAPGSYQVSTGSALSCLGKDGVYLKRGESIYVESGEGNFSYRLQGNKILSSRVDYGADFIIFQKVGDSVKYYCTLVIGNIPL